MAEKKSEQKNELIEKTNIIDMKEFDRQEKVENREIKDAVEEKEDIDFEEESDSEFKDAVEEKEDIDFEEESDSEFEDAVEEKKEDIDFKEESDSEFKDVIKVERRDTKKERMDELKRIESEYNKKLEGISDDELKKLYLDLKYKKGEEEDKAIKKAYKDLEIEFKNKITSKRTEKLLNNYVKLKKKDSELKKDLNELHMNVDETNIELNNIKKIKNQVKTNENERDKWEIIEHQKNKDMDSLKNIIKNKEIELRDNDRKIKELEQDIRTYTIEDIEESENLYVYSYDENSKYIDTKSIETLKKDNMEAYNKKIDMVVEEAEKKKIGLKEIKPRYRRIFKGLARRFIISKDTRKKLMKSFRKLLQAMKEFYNKLFKSKKFKHPIIDIKLRELNRSIGNLSEKIDGLNKNIGKLNEKGQEKKRINLEKEKSDLEKKKNYLENEKDNTLRLKYMYKIFIEELPRYENGDDIKKMMDKYVKQGIKQIDNNVNNILKGKEIKRPIEYVVINPAKIEDLETKKDIEKKMDAFIIKPQQIMLTENDFLLGKIGKIQKITQQETFSTEQKLNKIKEEIECLPKKYQALEPEKMATLENKKPITNDVYEINKDLKLQKMTEILQNIGEKIKEVSQQEKNEGAEYILKDILKETKKVIENEPKKIPQVQISEKAEQKPKKEINGPEFNQ